MFFIQRSHTEYLICFVFFPLHKCSSHVYMEQLFKRLSCKFCPLGPPKKCRGILGTPLRTLLPLGLQSTSGIREVSEKHIGGSHRWRVMRMQACINECCMCLPFVKARLRAPYHLAVSFKQFIISITIAG